MGHEHARRSAALRPRSWPEAEWQRVFCRWQAKAILKRAVGLSRCVTVATTLSVVRRVKGVLEIIECGKGKHHDGSGKCQTPHGPKGLRPMCRAKEDEANEHQPDDG